MDCAAARDLWLDALDAPLDAAQREDLRGHLVGCGPCSSFAILQRDLDAELGNNLPVVALAPGFRRELYRRLPGAQPWPEWLPELAYLAGAAAATAASVIVLPFPASSTWWIGGALAGLGLFVHSLVASALSRLDMPEGS